MSRNTLYTASAAIIVAIIAIVWFSRKTSVNPKIVNPEGAVVQTRLAAIHKLYTLHVDLTGASPTNADEFYVWARDLPAVHGPIVLTPEFLTSPRDKLPIVIRYGLPLAPQPLGDETSRQPVDHNDGAVIAHEKEGVGGYQFVVYAGSGRTEQISAEKAKELGLE